jgi:hypothetical protein
MAEYKAIRNLYQNNKRGKLDRKTAFFRETLPGWQFFLPGFMSIFQKQIKILFLLEFWTIFAPEIVLYDD